MIFKTCYIGHMAVHVAMPLSKGVVIVTSRSLIFNGQKIVIILCLSIAAFLHRKRNVQEVETHVDSINAGPYRHHVNQGRTRKQ